ncbi:hypothetical protein E2P79_04265 [Aeromonas schubertii]|nr:hypothetical protein E2P79_04265 [Aeromonas schubertii]
MMTRCLMGVCCLLLAMAAQASQVYQGTIGKMPVVMALESSSDGTTEGRYFYRKYRKDIPLTGKWEGKHLLLSEGGQGDEPEKLTMRLERAGTGLRGQWVDGKPLVIVLAAVDSGAIEVADPVLTGWRQRNPYGLLRLEGLALKPGKRETFQGYGLQWLEQPQSTISSFRVTTGLPIAQSERINRIMAEHQWRDVDDYFVCMSSSRGGEFSQTVTPRLLGPRLFSISVFTSYDCGGAHPDFGDIPLTLDPTSGDKVTLEDLLWVGKGKPVPFDTESYDPAASEYRAKYLAPWLVKAFQRLYPEMMEPDPEGCNYADPSVWEYASWYVSDKGIVFDPSFPRVARNCELTEWSLLPWAEIKAHPGRLPQLLP